ncbi:MAG: hypothetical protein JWQ76_5568 [Ramlibacter sp.]|nr:hypothetical protein [Ramlibacter sp.]
MSEGFLGRWAKRKEAIRKGEEIAAEPAPLPSLPPSPAGGTGSEEEALAAAPAQPPLTLEDTKDLTLESDFTRFTASGVAPEVKNAALKKLFADPHFNVMDRLDTYIDDYSRPDPIPPEMLRQLASAKFLKMFDEEEEEEKPQPRESAEGAAAPAVAQLEPTSDLPGPPPGASSTDDADPDLRLQQDHAPGPRGPGPGPA